MGKTDQQRDADQLVVERRAVPDETVVVELLAVVSRDRDEGVGKQSTAVEPREKLVESAIEAQHLRVVDVLDLL